MALTVETGEGLAEADAYISIDDADAYHSGRGNEDWADATESEKEAAIRRATFALDSQYRGRWKGTKNSYEQALAWPRTDVEDEDGFKVPSDTIPVRLKHACAEVALIELTERFVQQEVTNANMVHSETVGPISVTYKEGAPSIKIYPHIDFLLKGLASAGGVHLDMVISVTEQERLQRSSDFRDYPEYFNLVDRGD